MVVVFMQDSTFKNNTKCVHSGNYIDEGALGINTPIYSSTVHLFPNRFSEIRYPRSFNILTQTAVADKICALECGETGLVLSSGMAAITSTLFAFLKKDKHAIFQSGLYGGTQHFINSELERYGIQKDIIMSNRVEDYEKAIKDNTELIFIESPTNPLLGIIDLKGIAKIAKERGVVTVMDNTFATPINQNPLPLGIDIVIHSGTKYLNGHSDICCGAVITTNSLMEQIISIAKNHGGVLDTHACYLLERGLKTLGLRIDQQNRNAQKLAEFLITQPIVKKVYYPGLPEYPGFEIAKKQMSGYGGMLSFELNCGVDDAYKFVSQLKIITSAVSLGGVETILCFPAETSHAELTPNERENQGISKSLIRLSVGIEDYEDLITDIQHALSHIT